MFEFPSSEKPPKKFPNLDSQISQSLEQIDFEELQGIFANKIKELGLDPEKNTERFVKDPKDIIKGRYNDNQTTHTTATYSVSSGKIDFNEQHFKKFIESDEFQKAENQSEKKRNHLLAILCHEETHAVGFQETCDKGGLINWKKEISSGFSKRSVEARAVVMVKKENLYTALNEAVTERFSREICIDYLRKKGVKSPETLFHMELGSYNEEMFVLQKILHEIERECDIPSEYLWRVMLRGYFAGEDLSGEKIERLFKNVFSEELQNKLTGWGEKKEDDDAAYDLYNLTKEFNWTDKDRKRIRRWFLSLYNKMPASQSKNNLYY